MLKLKKKIKVAIKGNQKSNMVKIFHGLNLPHKLDFGGTKMLLIYGGRKIRISKVGRKRKPA